ncbi:MAG: hypothetical protein Q8P56_00345 [Candidatus Uhrbacteria bacterium]|nr:hypothetical protein [Candidatus Uhrbacteria bacterium]
MEISDEKFERAREDAERYYEKIGKVWCPYFGEEVHFNTEGFQHLLFKEWNKTRSRIEQYKRLRLIPVAERIIRKTQTLQEYDERNLMVRQKTSSKWQQVMKRVRYYIFIAIDLDKNVRVKVIVKEIEGGAKFFYSVYMSWWETKQADGQTKKAFHTGDPERD